MLKIINRYNGKNKHGHTLTLFECSYCLKECVKPYSDRKLQSCGCMQYSLITDKVKTHNDSKSKEFTVYHHIKGKCYNTNNKDYKYYDAALARDKYIKDNNLPHKLNFE